MKNTNSQVLRKTFAVRFTLARFVLAAILIPALLIGSAFTFGGSNLQAQANGSSKQGFFAGFVYLNGFKVDSSTKTTRVTNAINSIADATRTSYDPNVTYSAITTRIDATAASVFDASPDLKAGIEALIAKNCETGAATADANGIYSFPRTTINFFDVGTRAVVGNRATDNDGIEEWTFNACRDHFTSTVFNPTEASFDDYPVPSGNMQGSIISTTDTDRLTTTTNKSDKISGIGLQFGWRGEKWRASLTHFTGKGGDNELANTLVMADYFLNKDFFVGGGLASMTLTNGSASGSATSPVVQIGYKQKLTSNLSLNFGLTKYISGVSLKSSTAPTTTPYTSDPTFNPANTTTNRLTDEQTITGGSVVLGTFITSDRSDNTKTINISYIPSSDKRTEATQVGSRTVTYRETIETGTETTTTEGTTETTTETEAELKAPLVISISFHLSF